MRRPLHSLLALAVGLGLTAGSFAQEGKIDEARREIRKKGPDKDADTEAAKPADANSDSVVGSILGDCIQGLVGLFAADDSGEAGAGGRSYFQRYPYADGSDGFMWFHRDEKAPVDPHVGGWFGRVSLEESNDFHTINRVNGEWLVDTTFRVGLSGDWSYLTERRPCGCIDDLFVGRVNATFRLIQVEQLQVRTGIGVCFDADRESGDAGVNFTVGADWFPAKPWVVSAAADLGWLGSAPASHVRATAGATLGRWEVYGGYDFLRIGSVDFQGPVAGVRFWF